MKPFFFSLCCIGLALVGEAQCILAIKGKVVDADTKSILEKATVEVLSLKKTIITGTDGTFIINGLCPGDYTLRITHVDCQSTELHLHLKDDMQMDIPLSHTENVLKEVVVVGSAAIRNEGMTGELKGRELALTRGLTLGESLQKISGVTVLQTGNNIYKPVIQGLHSSRVLILNNGIRQEGQQWGSEHAPEIDPYVANRLTVIKGAASVRYGGDAIGGVILVEPRLLHYNHELQGEVNLGAFSNNRQGVLSAMLEGAFDKKEQSAWRLQGTLKRGGNARTPEYWLKNSGVEEMNMSASAGWKKGHSGAEFFYSIFHTRLGIFTGSHIGNLSDLEQVIRLQEPPSYIKDEGFSYAIERPYQQVQHQLAKVKLFRENPGRNRLSLIVSSQYNSRKEFDITRTETQLPQLELDLLTGMADLVLEHFGNQSVKGSMGINAMYQDNFINYRYFVPNYRSVDLGIWMAEKFQLKKWQLELGLRYDKRNRFGISDNDRPPFDLLMGNVLLAGEPYGNRMFSGMSGTAVAAYAFSEYLRASFTLSSAWRSPQVNELFSNGLHHGAARIEKGDPALRPERAYSALGSMVFNKDRWELEWGVYTKEIEDFIYLKPAYPALLTIRGAFPAFDYAQSRVNLSGTDLKSGYRINSHLSADFKASILRAFNKSENTWLIQMPADRFEWALAYDFVDGNKIIQPSLRAEVQHVTRQSRVPSTGNIKVTDNNGIVRMSSDYMEPPAAYTLVNLEAQAGMKVIGHRWDFVLGANNLFNISYRDYMNAFRYFSLDRGRNISLKLKIPL